MPRHARRHSDMNCAKTAEPVDLPLHLWTQVGRRKHSFNRVRQVVPMCPCVEYDWTVCLQRRCGLMSNYFNHLFEMGPNSLVLWLAVWSVADSKLFCLFCVLRCTFAFLLKCLCDVVCTTSIVFGASVPSCRIRLNRPSAAAMPPYVKLLWPLISKWDQTVWLAVWSVADGKLFCLFCVALLHSYLSVCVMSYLESSLWLLYYLQQSYSGLEIWHN